MCNIRIGVGLFRVYIEDDTLTLSRGKCKAGFIGPILKEM